MRATRLPNGNLRIPVPVAGPGDVRGLASEEITPDDPRYTEWLPFADEKPRPKRDPDAPIPGWPA